VRELQAGLWHWQAPHPEWTPDQWWPEVVSSYAFDDGARLLLFDPLAVPEEIIEVAGDREPVVVLTAPLARTRCAESGRALRRAGVHAAARHRR
jgi:hypothetical protein